jgi:hypothetical protein
METKLMSFNYLSQNTVEWIIREPEVTIVKMSLLKGDNNLAQLEFFNAGGINVGRGEYILRHGIGGQIAPYIADRYIIDYRNNYSLVGPNGGIVLNLNHQKEQGFQCHGIDYIIRHSDGTVKVRYEAGCLLG